MNALLKHLNIDIRILLVEWHSVKVVHFYKKHSFPVKCTPRDINFVI